MKVYSKNKNEKIISNSSVIIFGLSSLLIGAYVQEIRLSIVFTIVMITWFVFSVIQINAKGDIIITDSHIIINRMFGLKYLPINEIKDYDYNERRHVVKLNLKNSSNSILITMKKYNDIDEFISNLKKTISGNERKGELEV